jgi:hypothetical protein
MLAIQERVMSVAQTMEPIMRGSSQGRACARKQSGIIQQTKGWRKVTLRTLRNRSTERGANHESLCGGRGGIDDGIVKISGIAKAALVLRILRSVVEESWKRKL